MLFFLAAVVAHFDSTRSARPLSSRVRRRCRRRTYRFPFRLVLVCCWFGLVLCRPCLAAACLLERAEL